MFAMFRPCFRCVLAMFSASLRRVSDRGTFCQCAAWVPFLESNDQSRPTPFWRLPNRVISSPCVSYCNVRQRLLSPSGSLGRLARPRGPQRACARRKKCAYILILCCPFPLGCQCACKRILLTHEIILLLSAWVCTINANRTSIGIRCRRITCWQAHPDGPARFRGRNLPKPYPVNESRALKSQPGGPVHRQSRPCYNRDTTTKGAPCRNDRPLLGGGEA